MYFVVDDIGSTKISRWHANINKKIRTISIIEPDALLGLQLKRRIAAHGDFNGRREPLEASADENNLPRGKHFGGIES